MEKSSSNAPCLPKMHPDFQECTLLSEKCTLLFRKCTLKNLKCTRVFFLGAFLVRQPISNKIIKIGYRTIHFFLILRAFSTCPFYGTKAKLLKTEEDKNRPVTLYRPVLIIFCRHIWPQTALEKDIQETSVSMFSSLFSAGFYPCSMV